MRPIRQFIATILVAFSALLALAVFAVPQAAAHTGFDSSDPADGATIDGPVEAITLVFTGPAEPTGTGFEILDGSGAIRTPTAATTADDSTWVLRFDPPLSQGQIGVRWMVKAPDAHPIDGTFSFTATASDPALVLRGSRLQGGADFESADPLDAFLAPGEPVSTPARVGAAARAVTLAGTLLGVGALVFAGLVLQGERRDVRQVLFWVRRAGLLVVFGVVAELAAQVALEAGGDWSALVSPTAVPNVMGSVFGVAVGLRLVGGMAVAWGPRFDLAPAMAAPNRPAARDLVGVGATRVHGSRLSDVGVPPGDPSSYTLGSAPGDHVWQPGTSLAALIGAVAVVGAFLFDGHTAVEGDRFLTGLIDIVHVVAGSVWVGGVVMLAVVLWRRHRDGQRLRALHLALRFSVVATIALVAVAAAGIALTVIVLDSPSELWATEWGRTLLAKIVLVALAAAGGAYNHVVLIPQLEAAPEDPTLTARFRAVVTFEAVALAAVVATTALLMGAAT